MGFMVSRRWALFAVTVLVLAYGAYLLGQWQFHRLHDRKATNISTLANLKAAPVPVGDVLSVDRVAPVHDEWRRVTATGTYITQDSTVIRYQTRDGASGVDVVTPLRTAAGSALLVDRGWLETGNVGADKAAAPPPPPGQVTVVGWIRTDATGRAASVTDHSARAISSREIAKTVDLPLYRGFVDAEKESPAPATPLVRAELPDLGNGPHFFYGLQWYFFGVLAVYGFCYLAYDERKKLRASQAGTAPRSGPRRGPGVDPSEVSEGPEHPAVDGQHHAGDKARSR